MCLIRTGIHKWFLLSVQVSKMSHVKVYRCDFTIVLPSLTLPYPFLHFGAGVTHFGCISLAVVTVVTYRFTMV